jgi:hypothetical protein
MIKRRGRDFHKARNLRSPRPRSTNGNLSCSLTAHKHSTVAGAKQVVYFPQPWASKGSCLRPKQSVDELIQRGAD